MPRWAKPFWARTGRGESPASESRRLLRTAFLIFSGMLRRGLSMTCAIDRHHLGPGHRPIRPSTACRHLKCRKAPEFRRSLAYFTSFVDPTSCRQDMGFANIFGFVPNCGWTEFLQGTQTKIPVTVGVSIDADSLRIPAAVRSIRTGQHFACSLTRQNLNSFSKALDLLKIPKNKF